MQGGHNQCSAPASQSCAGSVLQASARIRRRKQKHAQRGQSGRHAGKTGTTRNDYGPLEDVVIYAGQSMLKARTMPAYGKHQPRRPYRATGNTQWNRSAGQPQHFHLAAADHLHAVEFLPTTGVVQVQQSVRCVCVCVCLYVKL